MHGDVLGRLLPMSIPLFSCVVAIDRFIFLTFALDTLLFVSFEVSVLAVASSGSCAGILCGGNFVILVTRLSFAPA